MNSITEIEAAIEKLPPSQMEVLASWLEALRARRTTPSRIEDWLRTSTGVAEPEITTSSVINLTRGEE